MSNRSREHGLLLAFSPLGVIGMAVLGILLDPDPRGFGTHEKLGLKPCLPMDLWGVPCPGCGVTTSVTLAAHGELWASFVTQPFGFLLAVGAVLFALWAPWRHWRGGDIWQDLLQLNANRWGKALACVFVLAWAYKWASV